MLATPVKTRFTYLRQDFDVRFGRSFRITQDTTLTIHLQCVPSKSYVGILPQECKVCLDLVASMEWHPHGRRGVPGWYVPARAL